MNHSVIATPVACLMLLCVGCNDSQPDSTGTATQQEIQSYAELAKARDESRQHVSMPNDQTQLLNGIAAEARLPLPETLPVLSAEADRDSPVPARFRLPMSRCREAFEIIARNAGKPERLPAELRELDRDIEDAIFWEMNQLSGDVDFSTARSHLLPARRAWLFTRAAEMSIQNGGIDSYFGNRGKEAVVAAASFGLLGLEDRSAALERAIAHLRRSDDGKIDWEAYNLPDDQRAAVNREDELFYEYASDVRAIYALHHTALFFTHRPEAFVPEPLNEP